jgi:hopanoid biosynthesis associated radical SAM protein HpnH
MRFPMKLNLTMASYFLKKGLAKETRYPLVLMLEPLHLCNLACKGCGRIREYKETMDQQLTADQCIESAIQCGAPVVSISGGEPMLYKDLDRIVTVLLDLGRHIYLCTNGVKLEEFVDRFKPHPSLFLNVHLDGQAEQHDAMAGRPGVFRAATDAIWRAKRKGFTVSTNTTVFKTTAMEELQSLFEYLRSLRVDGFFISPGFHYSELEGEDFLNREEVYEKFEEVHTLTKQFRFYTTPLYFDFLRGKRSYQCAPWGTVTRNPQGWKAPCYLITDTHYPDFDTWLNSVDWDYYQSGKDPRCAQCMMHSGFEPAAALALKDSWKDLGRMVAWNMG